MAYLLRSTWRTQMCHLRRNSTYPLVYSEEVQEAKYTDKPIVALESTIITHGMPFPKNLETALEVEDIIRQQSAVPATISIIKGQLRVGLTKEQIQYLANAKSVIKASRRDLAPIMATEQDGATTVAGTIIAAQLADIPIFVTGGIGGVHREGEDTMDVSADLTELGRSKTLVVCSGVKSILDIGRTLEYLETQGVTVCAFGESQEFPAFYTKRSGYRAPHHALDASHAARILHVARKLQLSSGIVIAVPVPSAYEMDESVIQTAIRNALLEANKQGIRGKEVTPFLLAAVSAATGGASLDANIALIKNNAKVGADIAVQFQKLRNVNNSENAFNIGVSKSSGKCTTNSPRQFHTMCATRAKNMIKDSSGDGDVLVIGGANVDRTYRITEKTIQLDGCTHACTTEQCAGGVARNMAEALWRLRNGGTRLLTAIGDDQDGEYIQNIAPDLLLEGCIVKGAKTAMYAALFDVNGECKLGLGDMDIHKHINIDLINRHIRVLKHAPLVVLDGNLPTETMDYVLKLCKEYEKPVFFEPTDRRKAIKPLLCSIHHITYASPNIIELKAMADFLKPHNNIKGNTELEEIIGLSKILLRSINFLFITRGPQGVVTVKKICKNNTLELNTKDVEVRVYNTEVIKSIENVSGAGDCFSSGFIFGTILGMSESQCISLGFKTAKQALVCKNTVPAKFNISNYQDKSIYSLYKK